MSTSGLQRSDARQNRERLVGQALALFSAGDGAVTLEAIAKAAGVGIGTLYRHFPTRESLIEAVYRVELDALEAEADDLLAHYPGSEAMRRWMDRYLQFVATKHAMHEALRVALTARTGTNSEVRARINTAIAKFVAAGSRDRTMREDIQPDDVTLSLAGVVLATTNTEHLDPDQSRRVLDLLMAGIQRRS